MKHVLFTLWSILIMSTAVVADAQAAEKIEMQLSTGGPVVIELLPERAPQHVERIKELVEEDFYNGIIFHRVIEGFMAQTGDPTGTGTGGSDKSDLPAEFTNYEFKRGTIGMARTADPNSANSQWFICFNDQGCSALTGQYTVWGQVVEGMEYVDQVARGEPPREPDEIVEMKLVSETE
jgi:peptidylprolyl isomerase